MSMQMRSALITIAIVMLGVGLMAPTQIQGQTGPILVHRSDCDYPDSIGAGDVSASGRSTVAAGSYLTAHHACLFADHRTAADRYALALALDPRNPVLMERLAMAYLGLGEVERAVDTLRELSGRVPTSPIIDTVLLAHDLKAGEFDTVIEKTGDDVSKSLIDGLLKAWAQLGQGRMSEALESFDSAVETDGAEVFGLTHKALAKALVGDYEGAESILSDLERRGGLNRSGVVALVQVLSQLERNSEALGLIERRNGASSDPALIELRTALNGGETIGFDAVRNSTDGASEVFLLAARLLEGQLPTSQVLKYSRVAEYLNNDSVEAMLLSAALLVDLNRFELATESYDRVPDSHHSFTDAEIGRAEALHASGQTENAAEVMERLSELRPEIPEVRVALGDFLRWQERFDTATKAYDAAVALYDAAGQDIHWRVYFARGITHERENRWDLAEADFRMALDLEPGRPEVLNYLGYSMVEMGINLDEALMMIEEAVDQQPDAYYIVDSLGWAQYVLGRYDEAVTNLERAVELGSIDPIVNDHLGDAYWAVQRRFEAEFQWRRALSLDPEDDVAERIRRKLRIGLDAVLEEEGAPPLGFKVQDG